MTFAELENVYDEYFAKIYNHLYYRVLSKDLSDDLTSDVFLKVVKNLDGFDETKASFKTWIYTIANNTLIDYYRRRKNEAGFLEESDEPVCHFDEQSGIFKSEELRLLHDALSTLDERTREVVSLKYNAEMSIRDIAKLIGINESTASTLHTRGLAKLRKILAKDFF
ncbi:MAG: RNA polymerase sigma factor [Defluviitaleaceae bacterium]|nr:RNA polymerase sigma factor [Defluviitaleaceae bacterium]